MPRYSTRHACLPMRPVSLFTDEANTVNDNVNMTTEDNETSLSTDKANTVDEEDNQAEVTPKPHCQFKRSVLWWSVCGFGLCRTAEVILVSSFALCTAIQDAVMTNEHKNGLGRGPSYSMMIKMMVPRILGVNTIHFDLYPGTHPANALDKGVQTDLADQGAACATGIVNSGLKLYAFGDLVQKALDRAAKMLKKYIDAINVPHPSKTSTFFASNVGALKFAEYIYFFIPSRVDHLVD